MDSRRSATAILTRTTSKALPPCLDQIQVSIARRREINCPTGTVESANNPSKVNTALRRVEKGDDQAMEYRATSDVALSDSANALIARSTSSFERGPTFACERELVPRADRLSSR